MALFIILFQIFLAVALVMGCAWAIAEFFPEIAKFVIEIGNGTPAEPVAEWFARILKVTARYAGKFLVVCIEWLEVIGLQLDNLKENLEKMDKPESREV